MRRLCLEAGCPNTTTGSRCDEHQRSRERARATRQARGYGRRHDQVRLELEAMLPYPCGGGLGEPYCGKPVQSRERWVAAHVVDGRPEFGYVPAHPGCNERAKGHSFRAEPSRIAAVPA